MPPPSTAEERFLIVAPTGADAENTSALLDRAGFASLVCAAAGQAAREMEEGCTALLMTEEAMADPSAPRLAAVLGGQPPWSDVPILLITSGGDNGSAATAAVRILGARSNVTLIERPLRKTTLVAAVSSALKARRRQYEVRDLLAEREGLLDSLEKRVAERTAQLRETISELEAFSYSISHDLRAPLRSMQSFATILEEDFGEALGAEGKDYLRRIVTSSVRMDRLIQDILTLSRVARIDQKREPVNLDRLTRGIIESYPQFNPPNAKVDIIGRLPPALGNEAALTQCISNLLGNAVKFVAPKVVPRVRIRATGRQGRVRLLFKDNGIGITQNDQKKIFGIFEKINPDYEGTGIGLAIVAKAAERMGGRVDVVSSPGRGSTFVLELDGNVESSGP